MIQPWERARPWVWLGCGLWDFEATGPIDQAVMNASAGAGPVQFIDAPGQVSGGTWNLFDVLPGTGEVHMGFVPEGGMPTAPDYSGLSITTSSAPREGPVEGP